MGPPHTLCFECPRLVDLSLLNLAHSSQLTGTGAGARVWVLVIRFDVGWGVGVARDTGDFVRQKRNYLLLGSSLKPSSIFASTRELGFSLSENPPFWLPASWQVGNAGGLFLSSSSQQVQLTTNQYQLPMALSREQLAFLDLEGPLPFPSRFRRPRALHL